ncbi:MAG: quinone-dependent dihydroorotate dehydrogenase [Planctomycetaceae bacterium]
MNLAYRLARPLLFRMEAERAHRVALRAARVGGGVLARMLGGGRVKGLERAVAGLRFRNPLGLAAGFDKEGVAIPFWRGLGFGFIEIGTVTPLPQPGNDPPRVWRFREQEAIVNRLGFPSEGAAAVAARVARKRRPGDVIGVNLGKNRDTPLERAAEDYVAALEATRGVADYWVVNVSSPNTPGLRQLQSRDQLAALLSRVREAAEGVPLFVKLSPDMNDLELADAAAAVVDARATGVIATNTTLERPAGIQGEGGLSGRPLAARALGTLRTLRGLLPAEVPIISVGGIDSAAEARARLDAGADLLQVYTALVFRGPGLVREILRGLGGR